MTNKKVTDGFHDLLCLIQEGMPFTHIRRGDLEEYLCQTIAVIKSANSLADVAEMATNLPVSFPTDIEHIRKALERYDEALKEISVNIN